MSASHFQLKYAFPRFYSFIRLRRLDPWCVNSTTRTPELAILSTQTMPSYLGLSSSPGLTRVTRGCAAEAKLKIYSYFFFLLNPVCISYYGNRKYTQLSRNDHGRKRWGPLTFFLKISLYLILRKSKIYPKETLKKARISARSSTFVYSKSRLQKRGGRALTRFHLVQQSTERHPCQLPARS